MVLGHRLSRIHSDSAAKTEASTSTFSQRARRMSAVSSSKRASATAAPSSTTNGGGGCGSLTSSSCGSGNNTLYRTSSSPTMSTNSGSGSRTTRIMKVPSNAFSSSRQSVDTSTPPPATGSFTLSSISSSSSSHHQTFFGRIHRVDSMGSTGYTSSASSEASSTPRDAIGGSTSGKKRNLFGVKYAFNKKRIRDGRVLGDQWESPKVTQCPNKDNEGGSNRNKQQSADIVTNSQFHCAKERTTAEYQELLSSSRHQQQQQQQHRSPRQYPVVEVNLFQLAATKHGQRCAILSFLKEALRYHKTQIRGIEDELRVYRLGEVVNRLAEKVSAKMSVHTTTSTLNGQSEASPNKSQLKQKEEEAARPIANTYTSFPQMLSNECWRMVLESHLYQRNVLEKAERALFQPDF